MTLPATLALVACSGEPAEGDMRKLVEAHTRRALERQGNGAFRGFDLFRKQGCVEAKLKAGPAGGGQDGGGQYDCYYAATFVPQPGQPSLTVNGKGRFRRTDKGLTFEDLGAQPR
ncbi:hypothetical protein [Azospirillum sp. TSO35-2]|uniref:hypothetical protein n=1 Tax=Azospirillum sp. TSO35-2 TaxID=716796 RepID=UPI000D614991|nr:hypothetical protein [Azospirillum sp. TSO35-2]PWC33127.1 hypothetical protein TSO352_21580 [Azospirillum sp. TSO35-2]